MSTPPRKPQEPLRNPTTDNPPTPPNRGPPPSHRPRTTPKPPKRTTLQSLSRVTSLFPIPFNVEMVSFTKNVPSIPTLVKPLKHSHCGQWTNLNLFEHLVPSRLSIENKLIPNAVFHPRFMSLFIIEHFVITFHPNGPKSNTSKEVANFDFLAVLLRNSFPKDGLFPIKTIIIARTDSTKFVHNVSCPTPSPSRLIAIPKLVFNGLTRVGKAKRTLFGDGCRCNTCSSFDNCNRLVLNGPNKCRFFAGAKASHTSDQKNL